MMLVLVVFLIDARSILPEVGAKETRKWINYLLENRAEQTRSALLNAFPLIGDFQKIFQEEDVPEYLIWLALIESSFRSVATSPTGAQGMFQFKPETARSLGLTVNDHRDERNNPHLSARAAARYLAYLRAKFSSWELVLAAYNLGEGDLRRTMKRHKASNWREVKPHVRQETRSYVGKVKAAAIIGNRFMEKEGPSLWKNYRAYPIKKGDTLYAIARAHGLTVEELMALNGLETKHIRIGQVLLVPATQAL